MVNTSKFSNKVWFNSYHTPSKAVKFNRYSGITYLSTNYKFFTSMPWLCIHNPGPERPIEIK